MATERPTMLISTRSSSAPQGPDHPGTPSLSSVNPGSLFLSKSRLPTLPTPPLSPQDKARPYSAFLPLALDPLTHQDDDPSEMAVPKHHFATDLQDSNLMQNGHGANTVDAFDTNSSSANENLPSQPILPSQFRKHHEGLRLLEKKSQLQQQQRPLSQNQQQHQLENQVQEQQPPPQSNVGESSQRREPLNDYDTSVSPFSLPITDQEAQDRPADSKIAASISTVKKTRFDDTISSSTENFDDEDDSASQGTESPTEISSPSYHSSGALIRAKSYSMFESSSDSLLGGGGRQYQPYSNRNSFMNPNYNSNVDLSEIMIPTRDWIKMHTRINSLETEIAHVTRTNQLLNQELDKVSGHLQRLTIEDGVGWRKEYEFLVQQVDLMHRQLQIAHSQSSHGGRGAGDGQQGQLVRGQPDMTRQLHEEVKNLTASLKSWQTAFQQADEKYRRKCDGERVLKQTLQERESQLSSLVKKLSGYEDEFKKSISNYEQLTRLTSELQALEGKKKLAEEGDKGKVATTSMSTSTSTLAQPVSLTTPSAPPIPSVVSMDPVIRHSGIPGLYPDTRSPRQPSPNTDHLTVSILSWAALLAAYILS
ncbi:hypothetical protein EC991_009563 [Linnemannia zychae]|nr:hypothetical protein EC991_009563 [Linnemannia zychae]